MNNINTYRILGIIPARGGSKGIKDKNIADICGRPLIYYTIETALKAIKNRSLSRLIVSTDSPEIADIAKTFKVEVPFLRPAKISSDTSLAIDYVLHTIDFFKNRGDLFDAILILQPTSPLRNIFDVDQSIVLFSEQSADSLISVYKEDYLSDFVRYEYHNGHGLPLDDNHNKGLRRQDHGYTYVRNGAIYLTKTTFIEKHKKIISDRPLLYVMPKIRSVNIDNEEDMEIARNLITSQYLK